MPRLRSVVGLKKIEYRHKKFRPKMLTANDFAQGVFITFFTKMSLIVDFFESFRRFVK